jgi:hypothetical protein
VVSVPQVSSPKPCIHLSLICIICPAHLILLDFITRKVESKAENNNHLNAEGGQHTVRNTLKEDLHIMWHKVRLLRMSEREKLPKTKNKQQINKPSGRNKWSN